MFDTHRYYHTVKEGGFSEHQAEAMTAAFAQALGGSLATKADVAEVKSDIARLDAKIDVGFQRVFVQVTGAVTLLFLLAEYLGRHIQ